MNNMTRVAFPDHLLMPESGWLSGFVKNARGFRPNGRGEYTAIIPLRPFELPLGHPRAGESVTTSLQFERLRLPAERVRDLAGASFEFPDDDAKSITVGELYIAFSYVPLILHRLTFGALEGGSVDATFELRIEFEDEDGGDESGFLTREAVVSAALELDTAPALLPAFSLLNGAYRPATKSILFLEVSPVHFAEWLEQWIGSHIETRRVRRRILQWIWSHPEAGRLQRKLEQWIRSHSEKERVRRRYVGGSLSDALEHLAPLNAGEIRRRLIVPTRSDWTAYFDNSILGTDPSSLPYFARELSCRGVRMCCAADATIFSLYGAEEHEGPYGLPTNSVRGVYAMNDSYWTFDAYGEEQPFEQPERYSERRIRDRFTPEMLRSYLAALGIRAFDEDFYMPNGEAVPVEEDTPLYRGERQWTFQEVQMGLPWAREG